MGGRRRGARPGPPSPRALSAGEGCARVGLRLEEASCVRCGLGVRIRG